MTTDAWETYWSDQENRDWWKKPVPEVLDLIRSLSPAEQPKVLDLGCGLGRHAVAFALAGCGTTTGSRTGSGALMGAAGGAAIGSLSGSAGTGALIGAGAGALGGFLYDQHAKGNID